VASDRLVPNDLKIFLKDVICSGWRRSLQAFAQFGKALPMVWSVKMRVRSFMLRSDSFSGLFRLGPVVLGMDSGCQPMFLGYAVVIGPMMECGLKCTLSYILFKY
jgi:hypothetical protein